MNGLDPALLTWPLFDARWYRARYREVVLSRLSPERHYAEIGSLHGYWPNALFDPEWVRAHQPRGDQRAPLAYFLDRPLEVSPHPLFDPRWYAESHAHELAAMPGESCALRHYLCEGAALDLAPHPLFDPRYYRLTVLQDDPDPPNPFAHYVHVGESAGLRPNALFDPAWVEESYGPFGFHCDLCQRPMSALAFYAEVGAARGDWPNETFDPAYLRSRYPALAAQPQELLSRVLEEPARFATNAFMAAGDPGASAVGTEGPPSPAFVAYRRHFDFAARELGLDACPDRALRHHLARSRRNDPEPTRPGIESTGPVRVSIIVPTYENVFFATACLHAIASARTRVGFEVIVADDASPGATQTRGLPLWNDPGVRVGRARENQGFLLNCNAAAREARGEILVFLNDDTLVCDDWLDALVATFEDFPEAGIVGARLLQANGTVGEAGGIVWADATAWNYGRHRPEHDAEVGYTREVDYVSGACLAVPRALFGELGGFDPAFAPAYYEDTDLAMRVRDAGRSVVYQTNARVYHFEGTSSGVDPDAGVKRFQNVNQRRFAARWQARVREHGVRGEAVEREKDRSARGRVLVVDAHVPTPLRDGRSVAMVETLVRLQRSGLRVTLLPANLDAPPHLADPLRGRGIQVLGGRHVASAEAFLAARGSEFDWIGFGRAELAMRLAPSCEGLESDILDLADDAVDLSNPPTRRVARVADPNDVRVITGHRDDVVADVALWLRDEIAPALRGSQAGGVRFHMEERAGLRALLRDRGDFALHGAGAPASGHRIGDERCAVVPPRFGGDVRFAIGAALAQGLPCVLSEYAANHAALAEHPAIRIARNDHEFAEAIEHWRCDDASWRSASRAAVEHPYARFGRPLVGSALPGASR